MMFYRLVTSVGIPVRNRTQCFGFRSWENVLENITFNEQILIMLYQTPRWQRLRRRKKLITQLGQSTFQSLVMIFRND